MRFSVVVNTYNRAGGLRTLLESLRQQVHRDFEVVVVAGPSTDGTDAVLADFADSVRVRRCPTANLGVSRNLGIHAGAGEVVSFIDDDAVPDPLWLAELEEVFAAGRADAVGGRVYDHTGHRIQTHHLLTDRRGNATHGVRPPHWPYTMPGADPFLSLLGTNCSFRRDVLAAVGGFDEEIEYFLDETDVCKRVIDAGFRVLTLDHAAVYHRYLPSGLRKTRKALLHPYPVVKNRLYWGLQSRGGDDGIDAILADNRRHAQSLFDGAEDAVARGEMSAADMATFRDEVRRGLADGRTRGLENARKSTVVPDPVTADFKRFPTRVARGRRLTVCLVARHIPPEHPNGIGRFTLDLARGMAAAGHEIHLLTASDTHDRVDLEQGVWVHRLVADADGPWADAGLADIVRDKLCRAAAVHREVRRIGASRRIDAVSAPVWDSEGLFCLLDESLNTALSLQTTMHVMKDMNPSWWSSGEMGQLLALERRTVAAARHLHGISDAILRHAADTFDLHGRVRRSLTPLGVADVRDRHPRRPTGGGLRVLFVGRLEKRKGIDLFLQAAATLAEGFPTAEFHVVGDDTLATEDGPTYREQFESRHAGRPVLERVVFHGRVGEDDLQRHYADCDVFCAPSRYESFGLILLEAMVHARPVVACAVGGMGEIVRDGVTGLLARPDDQASVTACLRRMLDDGQLRRDCGVAGRARYERHYTIERMAGRAAKAFAAMSAPTAPSAQPQSRRAA